MLRLSQIWQLISFKWFLFKWTNSFSRCLLFGMRPSCTFSWNQSLLQWVLLAFHGKHYLKIEIWALDVLSATEYLCFYTFTVDKIGKNSNFMWFNSLSRCLCKIINLYCLLWYLSNSQCFLVFAHLHSALQWEPGFPNSRTVSFVQYYTTQHSFSNYYIDSTMGKQTY